MDTKVSTLKRYYKVEWREITSANVVYVSQLYEMGNPIIIATKNSAGTLYAEKSRFHESFAMMARDGGYYYVVLPKMK